MSIIRVLTHVCNRFNDLQNHQTYLQNMGHIPGCFSHGQVILSDGHFNLGCSGPSIFVMVILCNYHMKSCLMSASAGGGPGQYYHWG